MESFRGVDYYGIEALLTEEQRMVRDAVRENEIDAEEAAETEASREGVPGFREKGQGLPR